MAMKDIRHSKWFDLSYRIGIAIKGFDGLVELLAGVALLVSPTVLHDTLIELSGRASEHGSGIGHLFANYINKLDHDFANVGLTFLIIFLIGHGLVKLVLVYSLLRRIIWAYPYALVVLVIFLIYQLFIVAQDPSSIGLWIFTILDVVIIWLVWGEWKDLKELEDKT